MIRVIDLACGTGHSSFLMRRLYPEMSVVAVDSDFISLYLAKRFMAPEATHLCLDAECPSPFPDRYFHAVFCLDAFHYLHSKRAVIGELRRILTSSAVWLFPHLHNALQDNIVAGVPLSPEKYLECFAFLEARLFDEGEILHGLCEKRMLDLGTSSALSRLNESPTLTLIGGQPKLWGIHKGFPSAFYRDRTSLEINPIYRVKRSGDKLDLSLKWPNPVMKRECSVTESIVPREYQVDRNELLQLLEEKRDPNDERLSELVSRFILVPLPSNYMGERWRAQG
ncbi:MAG: class I SAM-dependent methyltransferase [Nitrospirota bacterium]